MLDLNPAGESIAAEIGASFCLLDVSDEKSVAAAFAKARGLNGQERILVNCAGIVRMDNTVVIKADGELRGHSLPLFEKVIDINLLGTFRCIVQSATAMAQLDPLVDGDRGVIINVSSIGSQEGQSGQAAYAASKGAINAMTDPIAQDLARFGIRVNTILPGIFATPLLLGDQPREVREQQLLDRVTYPKRLGNSPEFASLVLELCRNPYMNGAKIRIDAGGRMPVYCG
jgi:NAD(P)-dependent dehydrogenase (short-subunit alcohol dehydrogenase family)